MIKWYTTQFPMSYVVVFFVSVPMCEMRGDCSFCWYWWNCWLSLFKTYLLNVYNSQCFKTNTICIVFIIKWRVRVMVFNATFNNIAVISWRELILIKLYFLIFFLKTNFIHSLDIFFLLWNCFIFFILWCTNLWKQSNKSIK
jgi:hypothetical protein